MIPDGYPLSWCETLDTAYWQLNIYLIFHKEGWQSHQKYKLMHELIPEIDKLIEKGEIF